MELGSETAAFPLVMENSAQRHAAMLDAARERRREAERERIAAHRELEAASAAVARVREFLSEKAAAEGALMEAEAASAAFTREWAASGASPDAPSVDPALQAAADVAHTRAVAARIACDGAEAGLPARLEAEQQARERLQVTESDIRTATAEILAAMMEPRLEAIREASAVIAEAALSIECCARALVQEIQCGAEASALLDAARAATPTGPRDLRAIVMTGDDLIPHTRPYLQLARRLLADQEASLDF